MSKNLPLSEHIGRRAYFGRLKSLQWQIEEVYEEVENPGSKDQVRKTIVRMIKISRRKSRRYALRAGGVLYRDVIFFPNAIIEINRDAESTRYMIRWPRSTLTVLHSTNGDIYSLAV